MLTSFTQPLRLAFGLLLAATCLATSTAAQPILVPAQFADLQDAIDAAPSGGTVQIQDSGTYGPVVVDKPLTILGRPNSFFRSTITCDSVPMTPLSKQRPPIELAGPGAGTVRLVDLTLEGETNGLSLFNQNAPAIRGSGFDELQIMSCFVEAPRWVEVIGGSVEEAGIEVDIPFTLISDSEVIGGYPDETFMFVVPTHAGGAAIESTGDVAIVDSTVTGGRADDMVWRSEFNPVPTDCDNLSISGDGGPAVDIDGSLWVSSSTLSAGEGADVFGYADGFGTWFICKVQDSPVLLVDGDIHELPDSTFAADAHLRPGGEFTVVWNAESAGSFLVIGFEPSPPVTAGPHGFLFADPALLELIPIPAAGFGLLTFPVPNTTDPAGLSITLQRWSAAEGLSRPAFATYVIN